MEAGNDDMSGGENGSEEDNDHDGDDISESEDEYPTDTQLVLLAKNLFSYRYIGSFLILSYSIDVIIYVPTNPRCTNPR